MTAQYSVEQAFALTYYFPTHRDLLGFHFFPLQKCCKEHSRCMSASSFVSWIPRSGIAGLVFFISWWILPGFSPEGLCQFIASPVWRTCLFPLYPALMFLLTFRFGIILDAHRNCRCSTSIGPTQPWYNQCILYPASSKDKIASSISTWIAVRARKSTSVHN